MKESASTYVIFDVYNRKYYQGSHYGANWTDKQKSSKKYSSFGIAKNVATGLVCDAYDLQVVELQLTVVSTVSVNSSDLQAARNKRAAIDQKRREKAAKEKLAKAQSDLKDVYKGKIN